MKNTVIVTFMHETAAALSAVLLETGVQGPCAAGGPAVALPAMVPTALPPACGTFR